LDTLELVARGDGEFVEMGRAEVRKGMAFQPGLQILEGVQVGRVRRQERHLDNAGGGIQVLAHELAAVGFQTIPDDPQWLLQVGAQRLEKLYVLLLLDRSLVQPEQGSSFG